MKKNLYWIIEILILLTILLIASLLILMGKVGITGFLIMVLISYILNTIISIYIFIHDRNLETKISWLIFIILIPVIGHVTFLFLGRKNISQVSKLKNEENFLKFSNDEIITIDSSKKETHYEKKFSAITMRKWRFASFEIHKHGFQAYESLFEDLKNATHHIHIEMYIMKPSEIYDQFKEILIKKANQGIEVRLIIDDFGKSSFNDEEMNDMTNEGIKIKSFNKIKFPFLNIKQSFRLHRKMVIIDGNIVHSGGINISDEYCSMSKKYGYWIDVNSKIIGDICNDFSQLFLHNWFQITDEKLSANKFIVQQHDSNLDSKSLLFEEGPNIEEYILEKSLMNCISFATKKIRISTPYFVPSTKILDQLKFALLEGVEIEIFIPGKADKKYILEATHLFLNDLILSGAKVYELNGMFLHSKMATFDSEYGYLGTINWDMRSFYSNYELLNFLSGTVVKDIDDIFDEYKVYSTLLDPKIKKHKTPIYLLKIFLIKILSPLI